jgi:carboxymethylenebutenolidase
MPEGGEMTELQRYLAEEVAEDHADGIITRREAMRRLGLLGVTGGAATAMLAASASDSRGSGAREGSRGGGSSSRGARDIEWSPVATEEITFPGPRGTLIAAWAPAERPHGGVLVIHENRGLNEHIRSVASRFAASGYSALAIDLLSEEGGTGAFPDEAAVGAALANIPPERFVEDMKAGVTEVGRRVRGKELAATGFCFGGGMVWLLLTSGERRLAAAAPFYGPFPEGGEIRRSDTAVLGVYAGLDDRVNATRDAARAALEAARLTYQFVTFTEAGHAFFNDTGARFDPAAMAEAYRRVLDWFDRFVAGDGKGDDDDD